MRRSDGRVRGAPGVGVARISDGPAGIVLASASPRRRELLGALVHDFEVVPSDIPEPMTGDAVRDAVALALGKAQAIARHRPGALVIGSDTIVFDDARSYGKPTSAEEAREMLTALAGREHRVVTAVAVLSGTNVATATSISRVELTALDATAIDAYVASGRPLDKAGAYAVQDEDVPTVALLEGCYCGVMGLPLWALRGLLVAEGLTCRAPSAAFERCAKCPERR